MSELYRRYYYLVYCKCKSFFHDDNDASDAAQDIMLKAFARIDTYKGTAKFSTWVYSITFNYCTDQMRKSRAYSFYPIDQLADILDNSLEEMEFALDKEEKHKNADRALSSIPAQDRELLMMKYEANKSISDLQSLFNLSASAVKMRLLRAKEKACEAYTLAQVAA
ncbi:MAG: sigma-70 family RNA polymerase sigma factor [Cyclobacteriaceae bacterium]